MTNFLDMPGDTIPSLGSFLDVPDRADNDLDFLVDDKMEETSFGNTDFTLPTSKVGHPPFCAS